MRILGVSGSLRKGSLNTALLRAMQPLAPAGVELVLSSPLDRLPHFNPDLEGDGVPPSARAWRAALAEADAVLISSPEYAYGMPGVLKNALDWIVGSGELVDKPVGVITVSPNYKGGRRALDWLLQTLGAVSARTPRAAALSIPNVREKLDAAGTLSDAETSRQLRACLAALAASAAAGPGAKTTEISGSSGAAGE